jgi:hypothetical protein
MEATLIVCTPLIFWDISGDASGESGDALQLSQCPALKVQKYKRASTRSLSLVTLPVPPEAQRCANQLSRFSAATLRLRCGVTAAVLRQTDQIYKASLHRSRASFFLRYGGALARLPQLDLGNFGSEIGRQAAIQNISKSA